MPILSALHRRVSPARRAFTLIELLIVVLIIGVLAAIAIPKFGSSKEKAQLAAMKSDLRNLVTAQEIYFSANSSTYAADMAALGTAYHATTGVTVTIGQVTSTGWAATATHTATSKSCTIAVGGAAGSSDAPTCD